MTSDFLARLQGAIARARSGGRETTGGERNLARLLAAPLGLHPNDQYQIVLGPFLCCL